MIKHLFTIQLLLLSIQTKGQDTIRTYFDEEWKKCKSENAKYYRKTINEKNLWIVYDYYIDGTLQMTGCFLDKKIKNRHGYFTYYYENGNVESRGEYTNNLKTGIWQYYYKNRNSQLMTSKTFVQGKKNGEINSYFYDDKIDYKGYYLNDELDGEWYYYFKNGKISSHETYQNGKLIDFEFFDEEGNKLKTDINDKITTFPEYYGGLDSLNKFLIEQGQKEIEIQKIYPKGKTIVQFIVNIDGSISDIEVVENANLESEAVALAIVKKMPNWKPGKSHNRPVKIYYRVPINFK